MLRTIIKRDGREEVFSPEKLNQWGIWASQYLGDRVDWSGVVMDAVRDCGYTISSSDLQNRLISICLEKKNWAYNCMAGRLYIAQLRKNIFMNMLPSVQVLHTNLVYLGLMRKFDYSLEDYRKIETFIEHSRDLHYAHFQIHHIFTKYGIQNRATKQRYELPQYTFMRMAMALAEDEPRETRLVAVKNFYELFSLGQINAPTPNYINLGTNHAGFASCLLYTVEDSAASLAIGDHIAYSMTYTGAGIGSHINTRSIGDPVRNGALEHQGKLPYFKALAGAVKANLQAGRGGACTSYYCVFDPEAEVIALLQNPRTPKDRQNRDIHFAAQFNRLFAKKIMNNEDIFTFTAFSAPDLMDKFFSGDQDGFESLYEKYEKDSNFKKNYVNARKRFLTLAQQSYDVGTHYYFFADEVNRHTPFKEKIYSSNLCLEIVEPTSPYTDMRDLYSEKDHGNGEAALCNLAAINICAIESDEQYEQAAYYALKMIDKTIHRADYVLPHIGFTAKNRLNAGVGIIGLAYYLARLGLDYSSQEGRDEIHRVAERHAYFMIRASLRLGRELGNAPWMNKTKWANGWLPIDTYKKSVDELTSVKYQYDWESLRKEIIANGGIRNSCLIAHMPTESSSKASSVPNGVYPIRDLSLKKSDLKSIISWCAPDGDIIGDKYELAWNISSYDLIKAYAILQKFCDQAISADLYQDRRTTIEVTTAQMIKEFLMMVKYGIKTRYYQNSLVASENNAVSSQDVGCSSGVCTL